MLSSASLLGSLLAADKNSGGSALSLLFLWFAQRFFSRLENKFPERL